MNSSMLALVLCWTWRLLITYVYFLFFIILLLYSFFTARISVWFIFVFLIDSHLSKGFGMMKYALTISLNERRNFIFTEPVWIICLIQNYFFLTWFIDSKDTSFLSLYPLWCWLSFYRKPESALILPWFLKK